MLLVPFDVGEVVLALAGLSVAVVIAVLVGRVSAHLLVTASRDLRRRTRDH